MKHLKNILLFIDGDTNPEILERSVLIAHTFGAKITIASVVESSSSDALVSKQNFNFSALELQLAENTRHMLQSAADSVNNAGVAISIEVLVGDPLISIIELVQNLDECVLIKAPSPEDGLRKKLFGGIDLQLMRACPCPVEIGRPKTSEGVDRVVVAIDYDGNDADKSHLNGRILDAALLAVSGRHSDLYILHAWRIYGYSLLSQGKGKLPPEELDKIVKAERAERREWLEKRIDRFMGSIDNSRIKSFIPKLELLEGDPKTVIPNRVAELDADLLGLGTASRSGLKGVLVGNSAEEIIHRVNCTVVVLKPEGFKSPVLKL